MTVEMIVSQVDSVRLVVRADERRLGRRGRLALGSCLSGASALLLLSAAGVAQAAPRPVAGIIAPHGAVTPVRAPRGAAAMADGFAPQDPTVRAENAVMRKPDRIQGGGLQISGSPTFGGGFAPPMTSGDVVADPTVAAPVVGVDVVVEEGDLSTTGDNAPAVETQATGTTTITVGDIGTDGLDSDGVRANGYGDIVIHGGNIATSGDRADGVAADNNMGGDSGGIEITVGDISTTGSVAGGVRAMAYGGSTTITAGTISTAGYGADGVYGWSYMGDTTVNVDGVHTAGDGGRGIVAYSGGTTTVVAGDVTTTGQGFNEYLDAGGIKAVGAAVHVQAGTVSTSGDFSTGIYANSNFVHDNGQEDRGITVTADRVATSGYSSDGIRTVNIGRDGNTDITVNEVTTSGDFSTGVFGYSVFGDIAVNAGTIETGGLTSPGVIAASLYGDVTVDVGSVTTHGDQSPGIYTYNGGQQMSGATVNSVRADSVVTEGEGSIGVYSVSLGTQIRTNIDVGSVTTSGDGATGIRVIADGQGDNVVVNAGSVSTSGLYADGIDVINYALGGKIDVTAGTVSTTGDMTAGIFTYANSGDTNITVDRLSTTGVASFGISAASLYGDVTLHAGDVTTEGNSSFGISVSGQNASVVVGSVTTQGYTGVGINAGAVDAVSVQAGTVTTHGEGSFGIDASGTNVTIDAGTITTYGAVGVGIYAVGYGPRGSIDISVSGGVNVHGNYAGAVVARTGGTVTLDNGGLISTDGNGSFGIEAIALGGDVTIQGAGSVSTLGRGSRGIYAVTYGGDITIHQDAVTTAGDNAFGVYAVSIVPVADGIPVGSGNAIDIDIGRVETAGYGAIGVRTFANTEDTDVTVTVGEVTTLGDRAHGVYASSLSGDVTINASNVTTSGVTAVGLAARAIYGDVTVNATNVTTSGQGSNAIEAVAYNGHVGVTASDITAGDYSVGILALGGSVDIATSGTITKNGSYAAISAQSYSGDINIRNDADIVTQGIGDVDAFLNQGILARAVGNVTISGSGTITTDGVFAYGVAAYSSRAGQVKVELTDILTHGQSSHGVVAVTGGNPLDPDQQVGGITVTVGNITTEGWGASGMLLSDNTASGDILATATGDISTAGEQARGVGMYSANGVAGAVLNNVSTQGYYSQAVHLDGHSAALSFAGDVSTAAELSTAIVAYAGNGGVQITGAGGVSTTGSYFSSGVRVSSPGDIDIAIDGPITTVGRGSAGIEVTERARHSEVYPYDPPVDEDADAALGWPVPKPRIAETAMQGQTITIAAGSISTEGQNSDGIMVSTTTGSVDITVDDVTVSGRGSIGVFAEGLHVAADVGNVTSLRSTAVALQGYQSADLTVHGAVAGAANGLLLQGYEVGLTVASGASIAGGINGVVIDATPHVTPIVHYWGYAPESYIGDDEPQPVPPANPEPGVAMVDNAGTIVGGTGYAITVTGGAADVTNSGVIVGAAKFDAFDDSIANSGQFLATKDSDFGSGDDAFVNTGLLAVGDGKTATSVTFLGLETFANDGGTIDLRNGVAGDKLILPGTFIGSGDSVLGLDLGANGVVDSLTVAGAATGSTTIKLNGSLADATLLSQPVKLVNTGAGSSADAFSLDDSSIGLVQYGLAFDAATGGFSLQAEAGAPVYRLSKVAEGAQGAWRQSADAWSSHMAGLRDTGDASRHAWVEAHGKRDERDDHRTLTIGDDTADFDLGFRQESYGAQAGADLGGLENGAGAFRFGVTAGYVSSDLDFKGGAETVDLDAFNMGGYAGLRHGAAFANLLVQYDRYSVKVADHGAGWSDKVDGDGFGAQLEVGTRFGSDGFFVEPLAALAWQTVTLDDVQALGQTVAFEDGSSLTGKVGGRIGGSWTLPEGRKALYYARLSFVHEFDGDAGMTFRSGGVAQSIGNEAVGDYGQAAVGVNILTNGPVSGFVEGEADFGGDFSGGGARIGVRYRF